MDDDDEFPDEQILSQFLDNQENKMMNDSSGTSISTQKQLINSEKPSLQHLKVLKKYFGHNSFRPLQWQIIHSILKNKRDNCAIMSTGYGKSLCYQFPALYSEGVTLVISPLISLMEDQVYSLKVSKISACLLGTAQTQKAKVVSEIFEKKYSIIYLTPEFATGEYGSEILQRMHKELNICLIAVDEAHCVSSWGHDFRPQYRKLSRVRGYLPGVPILAVTATATKQVEVDIISSLRLKNPQILHSGFDRPNLYLEVYQKSQQGPSTDFLRVSDNVCGVQKFPGPTIIYCLTRKFTETITELLKSKGINCAAYHAGKGLKERKEVHEKFLKDQLDLVVATNAFGMGIDKPDIRCVVHYGTPSSIEAYYQEIGRAGRDGEPARCVMFYSESDFQTHLILSENNKYNPSKDQKLALSTSVRKYLYLTECRRAFILSYFGEKYSGVNKRCCDVCYSDSCGTKQEYEGIDKDGNYDFTDDAVKMLKSVDVLGGRYGQTNYILFLRGSRSSKLKDWHKNHPLHGCGKDKNENWWKSISNILVEKRYMSRNTAKFSGFSSYVYELTDEGKIFLEKYTTNKNSVQLKLKPQSDILEQIKAKSKIKVCSYNTGGEAQPSSKAVLIKDTIHKNRDDELDKKLYTLMMDKRYKIADEKDCMPHNVISIPDVRELIRVKPRSLKQLEKCKFEMFSELKICQFGQQMIDIIVQELGPGEDDNEKTTKMNMVEALLKVPLLEKSSASTDISYNLFKRGLSIQEISEQRLMSQNTIFLHLLDCMKKGLPIKMEHMGVDKSKSLVILRAILETPGNLLTPIKEKCPPDFTWNDIRVVVTYYSVRNHLAENGICYEDFEDFTFGELESEAGSLDLHSTPKNNLPTEEDKELMEFLRLGEDIIREDEEKMEVENKSKKSDNISGGEKNVLGDDFALRTNQNLNKSDDICDRTEENKKESIDISYTSNENSEENYNKKEVDKTENRPESRSVVDNEADSNASSNKRKRSEVEYESDSDLFDEAFDSPPGSPRSRENLIKIPRND